MIRSAFATLGVLLLSIAAHAATVGLGYAADYNVFTLGDVGAISGHIVGRIAVGGNVNTSISIGTTDGQYAKEWTAPVSTSYYTYINGTNGSWNINQDGAGDLYYYSQGTGALNVNDHRYTRYTETSPVLGYSSAVPAKDASHALINFSEAGTYLTALSKTIAAQSANGTGSWDHDKRFYSLTANKDTVFNLTADEFAHLSSITTNGHSVIVNVNGESAIHYNSGNNIRVDNQPILDAKGNVLFNFRDATSIKLDDVLYGSILAPNAALTASGNLKGQIIVKNLLSSGEIHAWKYTGYLPPVSTPEPSTMVLMGSGLIGLWTMRGRKLRRKI